jgi:hypothetical protein
VVAVVALVFGGFVFSAFGYVFSVFSLMEFANWVLANCIDFASWSTFSHKKE